MSPDAAQLIAAFQLADSFFPSGMFTQSHGLERFVERGLVGEAAFAPLLRSYLLHLVAPGEALAARWVARAASAGDLGLVRAVDERLEATRLSPEGRLASRRCGGRILALGVELYGGETLTAYEHLVAQGAAPGHQAVALALCGAASGLDEELVALVELYTYAASLVSAAVRLGAIDHIAGQRLLLRARPVLAEGAAVGVATPWEEIGGFAPQIELMQLQHRYAETHMFVS